MMVGWNQVRMCNAAVRWMTDQEEGECIEWQRQRVEAESVQPHLGVFERVENGRPSELLLTGGIIVILQAELDKFPFFLG